MNDIFSVIVTYNFDDSLVENIKNISAQSHLMIIDNSANEIIDKKLNIIKEHYKNIIVIQNKENKGLPYCYNFALKYAKKRNYKYFVTFDQDTNIQENTLTHLINLMNKYKIDSIGPNYRNISKKDNTDLSFPKFIISSCNVTRMTIFDKIQYDNSLFIDNVDLDFCLMLKECEYKFALANNIIINHKIGEKYVGKFGVKFYAHSPKRYYYIYRNYYILKRKHRDEKYFWIVYLRLFILKHFALHFFKAQDKKEVIDYMSKGINDGENL